MLVRCPQCRTNIRLVEFAAADSFVRYLCPDCHEIVRIDLRKDEVHSTSSAVSYRKIERRKTVLVADDSPHALGLATSLLGEAGYDVLGAGDGVEALRLVREHHPDLVVLDLLMPEMNGYEVLREMRRDASIGGTPVVAVGGIYRNDVEGFLRDLGADDFLRKDAVRSKLVGRARRLVDPEAAS